MMTALHSNGVNGTVRFDLCHFRRDHRHNNENRNQRGLVEPARAGVNDLDALIPYVEYPRCGSRLLFT